MAIPTTITECWGTDELGSGLVWQLYSHSSLRGNPITGPYSRVLSLPSHHVWHKESRQLAIAWVKIYLLTLENKMCSKIGIIGTPDQISLLVPVLHSLHFKITALWCKNLENCRKLAEKFRIQNLMSIWGVVRLECDWWCVLVVTLFWCGGLDHDSWFLGCSEWVKS